MARSSTKERDSRNFCTTLFTALFCAPPARCVLTHEQGLIRCIFRFDHIPTSQIRISTFHEHNSLLLPPTQRRSGTTLSTSVAMREQRTSSTAVPSGGFGFCHSMMGKSLLSLANTTMHFLLRRRHCRLRQGSDAPPAHLGSIHR